MKNFQATIIFVQLEFMPASFLFHLMVTAPLCGWQHS